MNLAVQRLNAIGWRASGIISDNDVLAAVGAESRAHRYDQVILVTSRQGAWLAHLLHRDPIHRLRRRWRQQLTVFPLELAGPGFHRSYERYDGRLSCP